MSISQENIFFYKKYINYKKKYIRLKNLLFGGYTCKEEFNRLITQFESHEEYMEGIMFAKQFIENVIAADDDYKTKLTPIYCGLKFIFNFWNELQLGKLKDMKRKIIIDGMNIIRNSLILLSFLPALQHFPESFQIHIRNLIKTVILNPTVYNESIELLKLFIPIILRILNKNHDFDTCNIYITYQSKKSQLSKYSESYSDVKIPSLKDTTIFFVGVPCYTGDPESKENPCKCCHMEPKNVTTNEADDVVAIFIYNFFKNSSQNTRPNILWSFDNYAWYKDKNKNKLRDYCLHIKVTIDMNNNSNYNFSLNNLHIHPYNAISFTFLKEQLESTFSEDNLHEGITKYAKIVDLPDFLVDIILSKSKSKPKSNHIISS